MIEMRESLSLSRVIPTYEVIMISIAYHFWQLKPTQTTFEEVSAKFRFDKRCPLFFSRMLCAGIIFSYVQLYDCFVR